MLLLTVIKLIPPSLLLSLAAYGTRWWDWSSDCSAPFSTCVMHVVLLGTGVHNNRFPSVDAFARTRPTVLTLARPCDQSSEEKTYQTDRSSERRSCKPVTDREQDIGGRHHDREEQKRLQA